MMKNNSRIKYLKSQLAKINDEEKFRKENNKLQLYNNGRVKHLKQIAFHKCNKKNRWVFGGNRSGKTECGAVEVVYLARGNHPYKPNKEKTDGWVVSISQQVQRDVAQKKVLYYLNKRWIKEVVMLSGSKDFYENGIIDYIIVENVLGGLSRIGFKNCEQGREKFVGASLDYVWFDEEPPEDIYRECQMRVLDKDGGIFGTMTPLKGLTYIYDEIFLNKKNNPQIWYQFMEWNDNPFLPKEAVKLLEASLNDDELESRKFGRFKGREGLVYTEFDENENVIEPFCIPSDWQDNISIDPGFNNPLSCHFYARDYDNNIYVIAEHYKAGENIDYHTEKIWKKARELNWKTDEKGRIHTLIDSAANQKMLNGVKSVCELFFENNIVCSTNVNKDLLSGIANVKKLLKGGNQKPRLFIFKNCPNLIRELKGYFWGEGDNPKKRDDHALDELRYYIMSLNNTKKTPDKTAIERDKEKLYKHIRHKRYGQVSI